MEIVPIQLKIKNYELTFTNKDSVMFIHNEDKELF